MTRDLPFQVVVSCPFPPGGGFRMAMSWIAWKGQETLRAPVLQNSCLVSHGSAHFILARWNMKCCQGGSWPSRSRDPGAAGQDDYARRVRDLDFCAQLRRNRTNDVAHAHPRPAGQLV